MDPLLVGGELPGALFVPTFLKNIARPLEELVLYPPIVALFDSLIAMGEEYEMLFPNNQWVEAGTCFAAGRSALKEALGRKVVDDSALAVAANFLCLSNIASASNSSASQI